MKTPLFHFHASQAVPHDGQSHVVHVPKGIDDKRALLRLFSTMLNFPPYFGFNWDALDECLADLSWLQKPMIWIWHDDIPLASSRDEAGRYLEVLAGVLREPGSVSVRISFPERVRKEVQMLLSERGPWEFTD